MRKIPLAFAALLFAVCAGAAEPRPVEDPRYPVTLTPAEALAQKAQMQKTLVALRDILAALPERRFDAIVKSAVDLGHRDQAPVQQVVTTTVYRKMEKDFQDSVDKVVASARGGSVDGVLRDLSATMGWCQACHAALRQEVVPGAPEDDNGAK